MKLDKVEFGGRGMRHIRSLKTIWVGFSFWRISGGKMEGTATNHADIKNLDSTVLNYAQSKQVSGIVDGESGSEQ